MASSVHAIPVALIESAPMTNPTPLAPGSAFAKLTSDVLAMPFDMAREHYAKAVRAGLIERSMLASARFEQQLNAFEHLTLGPLARRY